MTRGFPNKSFNNFLVRVELFLFFSKEFVWTDFDTSVEVVWIPASTVAGNRYYIKFELREILISSMARTTTDAKRYCRYPGIGLFPLNVIRASANSQEHQIFIAKSKSLILITNKIQKNASFKSKEIWLNIYFYRSFDITDTQ